MVIKGAVKIRVAPPAAVKPVKKVAGATPQKKERKSNRKPSAPIRELDKVEVSTETVENNN